MTTSINSHGSEDTASSVPGVEVIVWDGRITVTFSRGGDSITFYVDSAEGETVEETLGRALLALGHPEIKVHGEAVN